MSLIERYKKWRYARRTRNAVTTEEALKAGLVDDPWRGAKEKYRIMIHENPWSPEPIEFSTSWAEWRLVKMADYMRGYSYLVPVKAYGLHSATEVMNDGSTGDANVSLDADSLQAALMQNEKGEKAVFFPQATATAMGFPIGAIAGTEDPGQLDSIRLPRGRKDRA